MWTKRFFFRITSLAWSPNGTCLAVGLARGVALLDALSGTTLATLASGEVRSLAWSSDGVLLAAGGQDGHMQVWEVDSRTPLITGVFHHHPVISLRWSPHTAVVLSASSGRVHLWDTAHNTTLWQSEEAIRGYRVQVAWAPDGQRFAFADRQYQVQMHAASGDPLLVIYRGHVAESQDPNDPVVTPIAALTWSPDGRQIATQGLNGTIQIWNATTMITSPGLQVPTSGVMYWGGRLMDAGLWDAPPQLQLVYGM